MQRPGQFDITRKKRMGGTNSAPISGEGEIFNAAGVRRLVTYTIRQTHLNGTMQKFGELGSTDLAGLDLLKDRTFRLKLNDGRAIAIEFITQRNGAAYFGVKTPTSSF
jgi:hypothetical protein